MVSAATFGALILSGFIILSAALKESCKLHGAVWKTLTLPLDNKALADTDVLRWTHNSTIIFYGQTGRVSVGKPADITSDGSLQLKKLKFSDAGLYNANVLNKNGTSVKRWTGHVCVLETVEKPQVQFVCNSKDNVVTVTCNVPSGPQNVVFSWMLNEKALTSDMEKTLSISLAQLKGDNIFRCAVANQVSKEMSDSVRLTCKSSEPASPALFCFKRKTVVVTLAGGGCVIILLLVIIAVSCSHRRRYNTLTSLKDKQEFRMVSPTRPKHSDSISPEYETMHPMEDSPTPNPDPSNRTYTVAGATAIEQSPVPKPRMKTPQTQKH
ncbi:T-cell surface antigen CD2-like [Lampris incognitus]|uniref:T-cell surface antigen CD2-like n=1 Tax=Lampris incognitus TaxID=2546036 RepID=UPI0024B589C5|nr:T-cell surface antigen CD2-like [Lampris incognitus]